MGVGEVESMPNKEVKQVDEYAIVRQSNELVEANYRLSMAEQKVILNFIAQLDTTQKNFTVARIKAKALSDACGFNAKSGYRQLQEVLKKLLSRSVILQRRDGSGWYGSHWVQSCDYVKASNGDSDCAYVEYQLDERLCPHFLQLRERFLKAELKSLIAFTHIYSTRFYMIFKNRIKIGMARYSFQDLCQLLDLPKAYHKKTSDLKSRVIKVAVNEINEKSDIMVEYAYYKDGGRAHVGVEFTFYLKNKKTPALFSRYFANPRELTDEAQEMLQRMINPERWNITEDVARKMIQKHTLKMLDANIRYAYKYRKGKHSLGGWLIKCIENDEAGKEQARIAEKKAEIMRQKEKAAEAADLQQDGVFAEKGAAEQRVEQTYAALEAMDDAPSEIGDYTILLVKKYLQSPASQSLAESLLRRYQMTVDDFKQKYMN